MYNYFKLFVLVVFATTAVVSQTDTRFFNMTQHPLTLLGTASIQLGINATMNGTNQLQFFDDNNVYKVSNSIIVGTPNGNSITTNDNFRFTSGNNFGDTIKAVAEIDGWLYAVGFYTLYKVNLVSEVTNSFINTPQYDSVGAFIYNNHVYIVSSGSKVYYLTHSNTAPIDTNTVISSFNIGFDSPISMAVDTQNGFLFTGGSSGNISIVNLATNTFIGEYVPPTDEVGIQRAVGVVNSNKMELYYCSNSDNLVQMDVFTYSNFTTSATLPQFIFNSTHPLNDMIRCNGGSFDRTQGQIFFIGASNAEAIVVGLGPRGEELSSYLLTNVSMNVAYSYVDAVAQQLTVLSDRQVYSVNYKSVCRDSCNDNGQCIDNTCVCNTGFNGTYCELKKCDQDCNGNGICENGICSCAPTWSGNANCSLASCYLNCLFQGSCDTSNFTCSCFSGYMGSYCQETAPPPVCSTFKSSEDCVDHTYCGWCQSSKKCTEGNRYGPANGFCRSWYFNQNVEIGVVILAAIFIGLIGILYVIDIVTTVPLDIERAKAYEIEFRTGTYPKSTHEEASVLWWRDQRSSKAWTLMDQFQFISLISHMGVVFPSRFLNFTEYLDWTNLGIPFPKSIELPAETFPSRSLQTFAQYNNQLESGSMYHLANILFWFGILCGAIIVPLVIAYVVLKFIESKVHWREVVKNRIIHVTIRILTFGYIGVIMAASFSLVAPPHSYKIIIPGAILVVLYGLGLPAAIWFLLAVPESRLHNPTFKQQFGCLYVNFKPKTDHRFVVFSYIKRFFMAVIIGVLAFNPEPTYPLQGKDLAVPIAQAAIIAIVIVLYAVLLAIRRPYFDHYHQWLEYFLAIVNLATVGLCLSHIKSPSVAGELLVGLVQALALVACIFAYIISWLQMRSKFIAKLSKLFGCGKKKTINVNEAELK